MQPPPGRYKVVERGRRLEVIDSRTGQPAAGTRSPVPPADAPPREPGAAPSRWAGLRRRRPPAATAFVTRPFYDAHAPRRVPINFRVRARFRTLRFAIAVGVALFVAASLLLWPVVPVVPIAALAAPRVRETLRAASTRFVDALIEEAGGDQAGTRASSVG